MEAVFSIPSPPQCGERELFPFSRNGLWSVALLSSLYEPYVTLVMFLSLTLAKGRVNGFQNVCRHLACNAPPERQSLTIQQGYGMAHSLQ